MKVGSSVQESVHNLRVQFHWKGSMLTDSVLAFILNILSVFNDIENFLTVHHNNRKINSAMIAYAKAPSSKHAMRKLMGKPSWNNSKSWAGTFFLEHTAPCCLGKSGTDPVPHQNKKYLL